MLLAGEGLAATEMRTDDIVIADFESEFGSDWKATGTAFSSKKPAGGEELSRLEIQNASGRGVASSEMEGDGPQGVLVSPEFKIERRYLTFIIGGGDHEHVTCLDLLIDGKVVRSASGRNSDRLMPVTWDIGGFSGRPAKIQIVDHASGDWGHVNVDHIVQTDQPEHPPVNPTRIYQEALRPQFHFTARQWTVARLEPGPKQEGWLNDLNGLIYYEGEYHLFAQRWWKCWLHAVSRDLIHWTEMEPAFWEESLDSGTQSGTCVIDYQNTSGLSPDKNHTPMVAFWTRKDSPSHCISYSLDHGRTWKIYDRNPVLVFPERDPKVFWHEPTRRWVMMLYGNDAYHILTSDNLLEWENENSSVPRSFECPDLFELPVDGKSGNSKWVLIRGDGKYSTGIFDGSHFKEESEQFPCDVGSNFYATQTWENTRTADGRRIQVAWMRGGKYPGMPFNQQVSFPCELTLRTTPNGLRLFRQPIREISLLHDKQQTWSNRVLASGAKLDVEVPGDLFHIRAKVEIPEGARLTFHLRGVPVVLTSTTLESGSSPVRVSSRVSDVEILLDRTSVEAFVNEGELSSSRCILPEGAGLFVSAEGGEVKIREMTVHSLRSAWETR